MLCTFDVRDQWRELANSGIRNGTKRRTKTFTRYGNFAPVRTTWSVGCHGRTRRRPICVARPWAAYRPRPKVRGDWGGGLQVCDKTSYGIRYLHGSGRVRQGGREACLAAYVNIILLLLRCVRDDVFTLAYRSYARQVVPSPCVETPPAENVPYTFW